MEYPLASANATLETLRDAKTNESFDAQAPIMPGLRFDLDGETSDIAAQYGTGPNRLFDAKLDIRRPGRWLTLTLELGNAALTNYKLIGLACEISAPRAVAIRPAIRNGLGEGFEDTFFERHIVAYDTPSQHVDVLRIDRSAALQAAADWRNLMFHFEPRSFEITVHDLRLFLA